MEFSGSQLILMTNCNLNQRFSIFAVFGRETECKAKKIAAYSNAI